MTHWCLSLFRPCRGKKPCKTVLWIITHTTDKTKIKIDSDRDDGSDNAPLPLNPNSANSKGSIRTPDRWVCRLSRNLVKSCPWQWWKSLIFLLDFVKNFQIWKSDSLQFQNRQCCPRANPRALDFFEKFWSNSRYVASLDGQMPHPLELQRGSNPPPSRHVKANYGNKFRKIFSHYKFLVQFVFAPHFKQRHIPQ